MKYIVLSLIALFAIPVLADNLPTVDVYKSPYCGCCGAWEQHMRDAGFTVQSHLVQDVSVSRQALGMPKAYASCHTARVGRYLIEGHVPAADVKRLLTEQPAAIGLAVPGMPQGSPGMESSRPDAYDTLLVVGDGDSRVFQHHPAR
jgi:hypothetical protein